MHARPRLWTLFSPVFDTILKVFEILVVLLCHLIRVLVSGHVLLRVNIETLSITRIPNRGNNGSPVAFLVDGIPVDPRKERVSLDSRGTSRDVSKPSGAVDGAELANYVLRSVADGRFLRENDGFLDDPALWLADWEKQKGVFGGVGNTYCL